MAVRLAERSLGSAGVGLVSGSIDSGLALGYLLMLGKKKALQVYQAALPAALSHRNFHRVHVLARLGQQLVAPRTGGAPDHIHECPGWGDQAVFRGQCSAMLHNAVWWRILRGLDVDFDPRHFGARNDGRNNGGRRHLAALPQPLLAGCGLAGHGGPGPLALCRKFCSDFDLGEAAAGQAYAESVLCTPNEKIGGGDRTGQREKELRAALRILPSHVARVSVLRRCIRRMEEGGAQQRDYESFMLAYSTYRSELSSASRERTEKNPADDRAAAAVRREAGLVDRRIDALAVLLSYFKDDDGRRPEFPNFFLPLPREFGGGGEGPGRNNRAACSVLISENGDGFDPLFPIHDTLLHDEASCTIFSPICCALGLPPAYVPARLLQMKFERAAAADGKFPDFEGSVCPILDRLSVRDSAKLAEWTSSHYAPGSDDRLLSLEVAHDLATRCGAELEQSSARGDDDDTAAEAVEEAVERVRHTGERLAMARNRRIIERAVRRGPDGGDDGGALSPGWIAGFFGTGHHAPPEALVERLLTEASFLIASAVLDPRSHCGMNEFRVAAWRVHNACAGLADEYSYINIYECAKALCRHWLVHGDDNEHVMNEKKNDLHSFNHNKSFATNQSKSINKTELAEGEDETINFVMDLNSNEVHDIWKDDVGVGAGKAKKATDTDTDTNLFADSASPRECCEYINARSALRIAFCLSYSKGYFDDAENVVSGGSSVRSGPKTAKKKHSIFDLKSNELKRNQSLNHARDILKIVFAKSRASFFDVNNGSSSPKSNNSIRCNERKKNFEFDRLSIRTENSGATDSVSGGQTITFGMRYRALRAASVLCPQELLEITVRTDRTLRPPGQQSGSLSLCAFGVYVACEIETVGLPLPHSDLERLSAIDFSSYARTLWRDFGYGRIRGEKDRGRLLLLLIDLCTKDARVGDGELVLISIRELSHLSLCRELICAFEKVCALKTNEMEKLMAVKIDRLGSYENICFDGIQIISARLLVELRKQFGSSKLLANKTVQILKRFHSILLKILLLLDKRAEILKMGRDMFEIARTLPDSEFSLKTETMKISCQLVNFGDSVHRRAVFEDIASDPAGREALMEMNSLKKPSGTYGSGTISDEIVKIGASLQDDIGSALNYQKKMDDK